MALYLNGIAAGQAQLSDASVVRFENKCVVSVSKPLSVVSVFFPQWLHSTVLFEDFYLETRNGANDNDSSCQCQYTLGTYKDILEYKSTREIVN